MTRNIYQMALICLVFQLPVHLVFQLHIAYKIKVAVTMELLVTPYCNSSTSNYSLVTTFHNAYISFSLLIISHKYQVDLGDYADTSIYIFCSTIQTAFLIRNSPLFFLKPLCHHLFKDSVMTMPKCWPFKDVSSLFMLWLALVRSYVTIYGRCFRKPNLFVTWFGVIQKDVFRTLVYKRFFHDHSLIANQSRMGSYEGQYNKGRSQFHFQVYKRKWL